MLLRCRPRRCQEQLKHLGPEHLSTGPEELACFKCRGLMSGQRPSAFAFAALLQSIISARLVIMICGGTCVEFCKTCSPPCPASYGASRGMSSQCPNRMAVHLLLSVAGCCMSHPGCRYQNPLAHMLTQSLKHTSRVYCRSGILAPPGLCCCTTQFHVDASTQLVVLSCLVLYICWGAARVRGGLGTFW